MFSSHRPQIGFLGSGWESGTWQLAPLQPSPGPHVSRLGLPSTRVGLALEVLRRHWWTTRTQKRSCSRPSEKAEAPGMPLVPLHFCTQSPRNDFSSLERNQLSSSLKLEVFSVVLRWGDKMYSPFQTRGPGRAKGLCTVHISQSNPNSLNHEIEFIQT